MQKKTNRLLSKMVLSCLIINTLPLHLPMYGRAFPKGQDLVRLKREINRDISSVKKTISILKKLKIIVPVVVFVGAAVITIVATGVVLSLFKVFKKILRSRYLKKNKTNLRLIQEAAEKVELAQSKKKTLEELAGVLKGKTAADLRTRALAEVKLKWGQSELKNLQSALTPLNDLIRNKNIAVNEIEKIIQKTPKENIYDITNAIWKNVLPDKIRNIFSLSDQGAFTELVGEVVAKKKSVKTFFDSVITDLQLKTGGIPLIETTLKRYKRHIERTSGAFKAIKSKMDRIIKDFPDYASELTVENLAQKGAEKEVQRRLFEFEFTLSTKEEALEALRNSLSPDESTKLARNSTIIGAVITALVGLGGIVGLPLFSFLLLHWVSIAKTNNAVKRLEKIENEFPGLLTARQMHVLDEFRKLSADPYVQGIIKSALLQAALSKTVDKTLKQYPPLIAALGGAKKATKALKSYIKLRWQERTFQKAIDEYTAMHKPGRKVASTKRMVKNKKKKIEKLEQNFVSKIKKARLDVTQFKKTLNSAAQSYIQQANAILEDLARQLIKAIETGKINLKTEPVIEL